MLIILGLPIWYGLVLGYWSRRMSVMIFTIKKWTEVLLLKVLLMHKHLPSQMICICPMCICCIYEIIYVMSTRSHAIIWLHCICSMCIYFLLCILPICVLSIYKSTLPVCLPIAILICPTGLYMLIAILVIFIDSDHATCLSDLHTCYSLCKLHQFTCICLMPPLLISAWILTTLSMLVAYMWMCLLLPIT